MPMCLLSLRPCSADEPRNTHCHDVLSSDIIHLIGLTCMSSSHIADFAGPANTNIFFWRLDLTSAVYLDSQYRRVSLPKVILVVHSAGRFSYCRPTPDQSKDQGDAYTVNTTQLLLAKSLNWNFWLSWWTTSVSDGCYRNRWKGQRKRIAHHKTPYLQCQKRSLADRLCARVIDRMLGHFHKHNTAIYVDLSQRILYTIEEHTHVMSKT